MSIKHQIKELLPYQHPFLFVDAFEQISEEGAIGYYTFQSDEYFYKGHFPDNPITPGVILIETMAQIGLVGLGMYLIKSYETLQPTKFAFTNSKVDFLLPVYPNTKVKVISKKLFFRLNKLKCEVSMENESGAQVAYGQLSGMVI